MHNELSLVQRILPHDSWFSDYLTLWPTVEAPHTFLLFTAMSVFGATVGRKCWFDQDFVHIYPMLNTLLIGPSGVGKGTTINLALRLIRNLPPQLQPGIISGATKEKLHEDLRARPKSILIAEELANVFNKAKYMEGMIPYITALLNYEDHIELRTKGSGIVTVKEPAATILGGSTIEWLQDQLPDSAGAGGFLARFLVVAEERKAQRVPLPGLALSPKYRIELEVRRGRAFYRFQRLIESCPEGSVSLQSYEVADRFVTWYLAQRPESGHLAPFVERSREVVLRLALLLALSRGQRLIDLDDIEAAISLYEVATIRLRSVAVPITLEGKLLASVLKALGRVPMTDQELCRALDNVAPAYRVEGMIASHLKTGVIRRREEDGKLERAN